MTVLENEYILGFEYTNEINKLFLEGTLAYVDNTGQLDKFIEQQFSYLKIIIQEYTQQSTDTIAVAVDKPNYKFEQTFFIKNIQIVNREGSVITYKIHFVSQNWLKLIGYVFYSNYNKTEPDSLFDIIKSVLIANSLKINSDTFDKVKTNVKTHYISQGNDNVISIINYLLNRLFYYDSKDNSIKFLYYDEFSDQYNLYNLNDISINKQKLKRLYLSMFKTDDESYTTPIKQNIASLIQFPKTEVFKSQFQHKIFDYDYDTNKFIDNTINVDSILLYRLPNITNDNFINKYSINDIPNNKMTYQQTGSYWNNHIDIYNNSINACLADSSIVVNCEGQLLITPSSTVQIVLDSPDQSIQESDIDEYQRIKNRYKSFEGYYVVTKTRNMFSPSQNSYTQNLVLYRNYKHKIEA